MAEGIRKIAKAMYDRGSKEEKEEAERFYKKVVLEGDRGYGRLSNDISNEEVMKAVGSSFEDVLVVFYHNKHQISILRCYGCHELILGPSFSCFECVSSNYKSSRRALCCDCYGRGEAIYHDHEPRSASPTLLHDQQLLLSFSKASSACGVRSVASAIYERGSDEEKTEAKELFGKADQNGDGKVSLAEVKRCFTGTEKRIEKLFQKVESNEGALDFVDFLAFLYYTKGTMGTFYCSGCGGFQMCAPFFACTLCLHRYPDTFDLCCDCYRQGKVEHNHPLTSLQLTNILLDDFMRNEPQKDMEELRKTARMQYEAASPEVQQLAEKYFATMDSDADKKVDVKEFLSLLGEMRGAKQLFKRLDANGDGSLDFWEVTTLYYALQSGRPSCNHCGAFIPGIFFSCASCFKAESSFDLCPLCYPIAARLHTHDGKPEFLDNYTLLQSLREAPQPQPQVRTVFVPTSRKSKLEVALRTVDAALSVSNMAAMVGIGCTIS